MKYLLGSWTTLIAGNILLHFTQHEKTGIGLIGLSLVLALTFATLKNRKQEKESEKE